MRKTLLITLLGASLALVGCVQQTPVDNQNVNQPTANLNQNTNQPVVNVNQNVNQPVINQNANTNQAIDPYADWQTYQNSKYGFSIKYPQGWAEPKVIQPCCGMRFEERISLKKEPQQDGKFIENALGFEIEIYKNYKSNDQIMTDEISMKSTYDSTCDSTEFTDVKIGMDNYSAKEVYITKDNKCFDETYFYSVADGNYLINIVPMPEKGNDYVGYDGKKETENSIPEFEKILSSFELKE